MESIKRLWETTRAAKILRVWVAPSLNNASPRVQKAVVCGVFADYEVRRHIVPPIGVNVMHLCALRQWPPDRGLGYQDVLHPLAVRRSHPTVGTHRPSLISSSKDLRYARHVTIICCTDLTMSCASLRLAYSSEHSASIRARFALLWAFRKPRSTGL